MDGDRTAATEQAARSAQANIKPMPGCKRRLPFSAFLYRYRNLVGRFFSQNLDALHEAVG